MQIAFCAAEVYPFAKTGGLGDVCGALPLALEKLGGVKINVFMPRYRGITFEKFKIEEVDETLWHARMGEAIDVYFIEHRKYFDRKEIYGPAGGEYNDSLERFSYFNAQVLGSLKKLKKKVDVVHCHDWHTGLIPVLLREKYGKDPFFAGTKTLVTIHNLAFQGLFPAAKFKKLGLSESLFSPEVFEFWGKGNILKAGILYADMINAVSPQYAKEIQTKEFGCGLESLLQQKKQKLTGILNGIDYAVWDPHDDRFIYRPYDSLNYAEGKQVNKQYLQTKLGLPAVDNIPLFGSVGRITYQKGLDLIIESMDELMKEDIQIVIQGIGERKYENQLKALGRKYKKKLSVNIDFNESLAHQIYASSDFFLMPSIFEPCGLSQMISLKYASVPIVSKVGGLADSIRSWDKHPEKGNGLYVHRHDLNGLLKAVNAAQELYQDKQKFNHIIQNGLRDHFSWDDSAKTYKEIYRCLSSG